MTTPRLWTKNFLIITLVNFFVYFAYYLLISIIALYAAERFHATPSMAGLSAGIFILGAIIGRLYGGSSIERVGHKRILYLGLGLYLITTLLYNAVFNIGTLIIVRILHGASFGLASTATGTISAEIIPNELRGEGTGYYALSMTIATATGPFIGMLLISKSTFNISLIVCSIALALSLLAALPLTVPIVSSDPVREIKPERFKPDDFFEQKAVPISVIAAMSCFGYSSILAFLSAFSKSIHLIEAGSLFFIVYAGSILISRPFVGRLFDRKGENYVTYPTLILFAAALITLAIASSGTGILFAGALVGLSFGNFFAIGLAFALKASPQNRRSLATSTYFIFSDIGFGIGPFFLGLLVPLIGYRGLYFVMAAFILLTSAAYHLICGRKFKLMKIMNPNSMIKNINGKNE
jgi:MFS family permease